MPSLISTIRLGGPTSIRGMVGPSFDPPYMTENGTSYMSHTSHLQVAILIAGLLICTGCGDGKKVDENRTTVSGAITFDGKPLPAGTISFGSSTDSTGSTVPIRDGKYASGRVPLGSNMVTIDTSSVRYGNPAQFVEIPERYMDPTKSGLSVDVQPGTNENVNFELKP